MSSGGDTSVISTIVTGDGGSSLQVIIAIVASSVGFIVAIVNSIAAYFRDKKHMEELAAQERRFEAFKKELEDKQRRLVRFENVQELMKQYKKPLLQSAFDLQARLSNQVKTNFLYRFARNGSERDRDYARLNMAYVISEFLGWLEVIRQEIVFIVGGGNRTSDLNLIIDAIKFQFTGETPFQGKGKSGQPGADEHWQILQLYAGELRAIGEVMVIERTYDDDNTSSNLSVIGYAEFVRRLTSEAPLSGSPEEVAAWKSSKEKLSKDILSPLLSYIDRLMELDDASTPKRRMAILQVLLCKLIDVLDDAVPYELGPEFNLENGEEPRYIPRDFRLTPLVSYLSEEQIEWLAVQRFMEKVEPVNDQAYENWRIRLSKLSDAERRKFERLAFPGFREDLHCDQDGQLLTQEQREVKLKGDAFAGAFPPRQKRRRELWWWDSLSSEDYRHWSKEARRQGAPVPGAMHRAGSARRDGDTSGPANSRWPWSGIRNRKAVAPVPARQEQGQHNGRGSYSPNILTVPSKWRLQENGAGSASGGSEPRSPAHPAANPRASAGL